MERACRLVRETRATVAEVALWCGFKTPQYFNRSFARRMGTPPGQWRQKQTVEPN